MLYASLYSPDLDPKSINGLRKRFDQQFNLSTHANLTLTIAEARGLET
jgi:hypothetical protein